MGMLNLGGKGIFISDKAREELHLKVTEAEFEALKEQMKNQEGKHKCFITGLWYDASDGIYFPPTMMADAIEKQLTNADKIYEEFKSGTMGCLECGKKFNFSSQFIECPYCGAKINSKKYEKKIKLPAARKTTFNLYIKYLRKEARK